MKRSAFGPIDQAFVGESKRAYIVVLRYQLRSCFAFVLTPRSSPSSYVSTVFSFGAVDNAASPCFYPSGIASELRE